MNAAIGPVVVASDLDRTLIYSAGALDLAAGAPSRLTCVEMFEDKPLSYMTETAAAALVLLAETAVFVPTTTRTRAQLARVELPGPSARYAIAANGGFLLVDGEPDTAWDAHVADTLAATCCPLAEVWEHLGRVCSPEWAPKLRTAEDLFCYAVVERHVLPPGFVAELTSWATERGWGTSLQGRKLYLVPTALTKDAAVAEVARRVGAVNVFAAGDSLLDAKMLATATAGIRPSHGELAKENWTAAHVIATKDTGVLAGQEIIEWLLAAVRAVAATA
jgi:hypothetical protein